MASIHKELAIEVSPGQAWAALRRVGDAHTLFAPVLVNAQLDGDVRTVRFANGMVLHITMHPCRLLTRGPGAACSCGSQTFFHEKSRTTWRR
jgi:hypothetical protein